MTGCSTSRPDWDDDEALLADLADAVGDSAPMAARVAGHAQNLFAWRTVEHDLQLAGLAFDSAVEPLPATRSGAGGSRLLVFEGEPLSVELEVTERQILGQLIPPAAGLVVVEGVSGEVGRIEVDERGFFIVEPVPRERVRLRCDTSASRVVTDWFGL